MVQAFIPSVLSELKHNTLAQSQTSVILLQRRDLKESLLEPSTPLLKEAIKVFRRVFIPGVSLQTEWFDRSRGNIAFRDSLGKTL